MSLRPPDHSRGLFYALFFTWLYLGSALWYCVAALRPPDLLALAEGCLGVGVLVYGITTVHRLFWIDALPALHGAGVNLLGLSLPGAAFLHGLGLAILVVSFVLIAWARYHAEPEKWSLERSLVAAVILASPICLYEFLRASVGMDIFDFLVGLVFSGGGL
ncbi:hypothetical protein ACFL6X_06210 [Candidatus Latescibacterota bacterium]